ncbi:hypothetical protein RFI_39820, partial [Reticulomyxa filosa]
MKKGRGNVTLGTWLIYFSKKLIQIIKTNYEQNNLNKIKKNNISSSIDIINQQKNIQLFEICSVVFDHKIAFAGYMLPYLMDELFKNQCNYQDIYKEISDIMEMTSNPQMLIHLTFENINNIDDDDDDDEDDNEDDKEIIEEKEKDIIINNNNNNNILFQKKNAKLDKIIHQTQLCARRIFHCLDVLFTWHANPERSNLIKDKLVINKKYFRQQYEFLYHLDFLQLSKAAYSCKSYSRALKYFEHY